MRHSILSGQKDTICLDNDLSINSAPLFKINKDVFEQGNRGTRDRGTRDRGTRGTRETRGTVDQGGEGNRRIWA